MAGVLGQTNSSLAAQATTFNCTFVPVSTIHEIVSSCPRELYLGKEQVTFFFFYNSRVTSQRATQANFIFSTADKTQIYSARGSFSQGQIQAVNFTIDPTKFTTTETRYKAIVELRIFSLPQNATVATTSTVILPPLEIRSGDDVLNGPPMPKNPNVTTINLVPTNPTNSPNNSGFKDHLSVLLGLAAILLF